VNAATNSNARKTTMAEYKTARNAGGVTFDEIKERLQPGELIVDSRWLDPVTDLWIPRGVFPLHITRRRGVKMRDQLEL